MKKIFLFLILILCFSVIYAQKEMKIQIETIKDIPEFPSGSGVAKSGGKIYAIGDDSPFLYQFNEHFQIESKIKLMEVADTDFKANRIKKKKKPDFETLEMISERELVVFGSGSKSPQRDVFKRVFLGEKPKVESYSITAFYNHLKGLPAFQNSELNIEATTFRQGFLYLFNRANNVMIRFDYQQFLAYLSTGKLPKIESVKIELPKINGFEAGFSGATMLTNSKLVFTASVEETDNAYSDGKIIGSLVGVMQVSDFQNSKVTHYALLRCETTPLKVESVALDDPKYKENTRLILITDDDKGGTQLIRVRLDL